MSRFIRCIFRARKHVVRNKCENGDRFILTHGEGCLCLVLNKSVPFSYKV